MNFFRVEFRAARLEPEDPFRASYIEVSALRRALSMPEACCSAARPSRH